jgi:coenzyme F420-reducing hydrogenase alpha subunit
MADLAGRLNIELKRLGTGVHASILSSRPVAASRIFSGKTPGETILALPSLYSVCATAQTCACVSACEAAQGLSPSPAVLRLRQLLVDAETVKEHLWRMLLDWPRFVGRVPEVKGMQVAVHAYEKLRAALVSGVKPFRLGAGTADTDVPAAAVALDEIARLGVEHIFGVTAARWLETMQSPEDLLAWSENMDTPPSNLVREVHSRGWASAGRSPVTSLPRLSAADLEPQLSSSLASRFVAEPIWKGEPKESSPFVRRLAHPLVAALTDGLGNGLLPRLAAHLAELASLQQDLRSGLSELDEPARFSFASVTADGVGVALVPAARGLLVHRVAVDQGLIRDYWILAPTEWNFHPRGVVAKGLSTLSSTNAATLKRQASLFVTAVDPCVEYHVRVA